MRFKNSDLNLERSQLHTREVHLYDQASKFLTSFIEFILHCTFYGSCSTLAEEIHVTFLKSSHIQLISTMLKPLKPIYDEEIKRVNTHIKHCNCNCYYNTVTITADC